jgi:hypothetical protein
MGRVKNEANVSLATGANAMNLSCLIAHIPTPRVWDYHVKKVETEILVATD